MSTPETPVRVPETDWLKEALIGEYVILTFSPKNVLSGYVDDFLLSEETEEEIAGLPEDEIEKLDLVRDTMSVYAFDEWGMLRRYEVDLMSLGLRRQAKMETVPSKSLGQGLSDWIAATLSTQYNRDTQLIEVDCNNTRTHEMHEWAEGRYCTGRGTDFYALSPADLRDRLHLDPADLYRDALFYYLSADDGRTERKFQALWARWAGGKANMPLAVSSALKRPNPQHWIHATIAALAAEMSN